VKRRWGEGGKGGETEGREGNEREGVDIRLDKKQHSLSELGQKKVFFFSKPPFALTNPAVTVNQAKR